ncbi:hypothetical protein AB0P21_09740 [Kribbella sp. NPDC056861]|uniref:hypothetical protein n=1 Tax=Kribbella sp. NPDC056861 TaxID=3154857 RepID=UPI00341F3757
MLEVTITDYETITGTQVPKATEPQVRARLGVIAALVWAYLGPQATAVDAAYRNVLVYLTVMKAFRADAVPIGIRSESVGSTSVSYADGFGDPLTFTADERSVLDGLMGRPQRRTVASVIVELA